MSKENSFMNNQAVQHGGMEENCTDCCDDPVLFHMRDNYHEFSMGLFPILRCLRLAEEDGHVPPLGDEWWINIRVRYHVKL